MKPYRGFADTIRRRRKELDQTLDDISTATGLSLPYVSELERGVKQPPLGLAVEKLAKALDLDPQGLEKLARLSRRTVEIDLDGAAEPQRRLAVLLHRKLERGMTQEQAEQAIRSLQQILGAEEE